MIIDGKAIAVQVKASLQGSDAKLAVIMVGDDPASSVYVRNKEHACAEVGIQSCSRRLPATALAITPVPGGVGPMTVAMLLKNTVEAASYQKR